MNKISIIGFGKIGQAISALLLHKETNVLAVDTNTALLDSIRQQGYHSTEPGLKEIIQPGLADGRLTLSGDYAQVSGSEAVIICIPLGVTDQNQVNKSLFLDCIRQLAPSLRNKAVLVLETTVPVGFIRQEMVTTLEQLGCVHGRDFFMACSPERIKSGTMLQQLASIPKAIAGLDEAAADAAYNFYLRYFSTDQLVKLPSLEAAEFMKLSGMVYRDINIALSNQLALLANAHGINFQEMLSLINGDNEANLLQPGIGVAGHCTPVYPYFLIENFQNIGLDFSLAAEGRRINDEMAAYAVSLVQPHVVHKKVLILGLAFRPGVKEDAGSVAYRLKPQLEQAGIESVLHDPHYSEQEIQQRGFACNNNLYESGAEALILVTMHREYNSIDWSRMASSGIRYVVDGRNQLDKEAIKAAGIHYWGIGRS